MYEPKGKGTFRSDRWKKDYSPDLCIISRKSLNEVPKANKTIIDDSLHSQHRPVIVEWKLVVQLVISPPIPRWNPKKRIKNELANVLKRLKFNC